ncbi:hypothetical protein Tco_1371334 [Tanacetum coccineum]
MTTSELNQLPLEPSRQEEFEDIVRNFILDQEEKVMQLEEYMKVIIGDFMQLSSEVTRRLKDKIREEGSRMSKIKKITKYLDMEVSKPLAGHKFPKTPSNKSSPMPSNLSPQTHYDKERISKKRTKNEAKTTKPDTEWKSVEKTQSSPSPSVEKSTQVNPDKPEAKSQEKQV